MKKAISILFCAALFFAGTGIGLGVNVFMERGVPVINGGGELLLLLAIPASIAVGCYIGRTKSNKKSGGTDYGD